MSTLTANQHYVWQYYLRAWGAPKKIWCMRLGQAEPFPTTPRNVASGRFFYEFEELTPDDLAYVEQLISQSSDEGLREVNRGWVRYFQATFAIRRQLADRDVEPAARVELETELRKIEKTIGETFHGGTEKRAIPILDALRREDATFYDDDVEACSTFIQFITHQYFRTSKLRNAMNAIEHPLPHDMKRTWPIEAFIYATNVGASLFRQRSQCRITFLRNRSATPFIAGDQPVINLSGVEVEELNFFYPLTPNLAMIYSTDPSRYAGPSVDLGSIAVESYNFRIYAKSETQIFGNDPDYLKALSQLPKDGLIA